jgi:hypothetical protein
MMLISPWIGHLEEVLINAVFCFCLVSQVLVDMTRYYDYFAEQMQCSNADGQEAGEVRLRR